MTTRTLTLSVRSVAFVLVASLVAACSSTNTQKSGPTSANAAPSGAAASTDQTPATPTALTVDAFQRKFPARR